MEDRYKTKLRMGPGGMRVLYEDRLACPTLKLLVDAAAGLVLYAEAGRDAVYFLFSLLTQGFLDEDLVAGSIGNLYSSFKRLDGDVSNLPPFPLPLPGEDDDAEPGRRRLPSRAAAAGGAVEYAVMDDLRVVPLSSVSGVARRSMLRGEDDAGALKEMTVTLGSTEGWAIWMASLESKRALTDAFLRKKKKPAEHPVLGIKRGGAKSVAAFFSGLFCCALHSTNE